MQTASEVRANSGPVFLSDAAKPYQRPEATSIYELLRSRSLANPEAPAVEAPGRAPLNYGPLLGQVDATIAALRSLQLKRNDRVAIVLPNGPEMATAFLSVSCAATCAPLNPAYRAEEFDFYLSDLNAQALIIQEGMKSPAIDVAVARKVPIVKLKPALQGPAGTFDLTAEAAAGSGDVAQAEDIALVLHTSGTTSRPKIVPLTHANVCNSSHNISLTLELTEKDRCLSVMPLFHIHGLIAAVLSSITAGASVICTGGFDLSKFFGWLDTFNPTWYTAVPTIHQAVLSRAAANREILARRPLRFIRSCSAPLPPKVMADLEEVFQSPVIEAYGMTEAAHQMTSNPLGGRPRKPGSVGIAAGPEVAVMDAVGSLLPAGQIGEVVISGVNVTPGYENNPKANQASFTDGWFRTGDQGRFDEEGYLFLTGRLKEIINRGGEKIAPREVDDVLTQNPAVAQALTFAVPHPTLGEDIAAVVVLKENASATEAELRDFAAARLADFKVPRQVLILNEIPKGPTGKPQRIGLADKLADKLASSRQTEFVAAQSPVEEQIIEIWRSVLKVDRIGVRDQFWALGGDSLLMTNMLLKVEERFGCTIPVDSVLRNPTIEAIAASIERREPPAAETEAGGSVPVVRDGVFSGLRNRLFQYIALYVPGFKTTRVWLHRKRGVSIGDNVSIGLAALIETAYPRLVSIGNNVSIGIRAVIIGHLRDSTVEARISNRHTVRIEDDVYIGPGVIVLPNVTIGRGAVVSAGSVVNRSVPPQTLVQGNPARPVAHCGVSLGGGVSYEQFLRHLKPITDEPPAAARAASSRG